ncbi:inner membrane protein [Photobacterium damselae subsp. piscicida]|uniref:UPF0056 membrane protein n=1 Tax=Photobacterium damsela subsp. piscicida TaxID=38294 RepID=A0AAD1FPH7_PHODP|nr:inner membrane protein [Photobacterium damselae subsp. piscicida]GAW46556.1 inner membrane protein [Photobacterium damselae subsp. piscicida]
MHDIGTMAVSAFMGFFAMMNPFANTAVFVGMTGGLPAKQVRAIAFKALVTAFAIIAAFSFLEKGIFEVFGITLPALRMAGGVLVFLVGYHMLQGNSSSMHSSQNASREIDNNPEQDIAISPLALPNTP